MVDAAYPGQAHIIESRATMQQSPCSERLRAPTAVIELALGLTGRRTSRRSAYSELRSRVQAKTVAGGAYRSRTQPALPLT